MLSITSCGNLNEEKDALVNLLDAEYKFIKTLLDCNNMLYKRIDCKKDTDISFIKKEISKFLAFRDKKLVNKLIVYSGHGDDCTGNWAINSK